jgi:hypothetical protein
MPVESVWEPTGDVGSLVGDGDDRRGNRGAARVGYRAGKSAAFNLPHRGERNQEKNRGEKEEAFHGRSPFRLGWATAAVRWFVGNAGVGNTHAAGDHSTATSLEESEGTSGKVRLSLNIEEVKREKPNITGHAKQQGDS